MAKSVKKPGAAPKAAAKPQKSAANKSAKKKSAETLSTGKKPVASTNGTGSSLVHDQIALLAHRFWIERGHAHGHDEEDWFRAEQYLRSRAS